MVAYYVTEDLLPYCETLTDSNSSQCRPCPEFGICLEGQLYRCQEPYTIYREECVESSKLQQDAARMQQDIRKFLETSMKHELCSQWQVNPDADTVLRLSRAKVYRAIRKGNSWNASPVEIFNVTFGKAFASLSTDKDELQISLSSAAPVWCQVLHFQAKHPNVTIGLVSIFFVGWFILQTLFQRKYERRVTDEILSQVQDILIDQSKASKDDLREYPVDNLRDHVLDVLDYSHSERNTIKSKIWPKIRRIVQFDSRIRERTIRHRGRQVMSWEWISQNLTKSNARRESKTTPVIKKTLDF